MLVLGPFPVNRRQDNKERERERGREKEKKEEKMKSNPFLGLFSVVRQQPISARITSARLVPFGPVMLSRVAAIGFPFTEYEKEFTCLRSICIIMSDYADYGYQL